MPLSAEYKRTVCSQSKLTCRGFTIPKEILTPADLKELKAELTLQPVLSHTEAQLLGPDGATRIPVYRENESKIYMPRYYGLRRYGEAAVNQIAAGLSIECEFAGSLRDYQQPIVDCYLNHVREAGQGSGAILEVPCAYGKTVMSIYLVAALRVKTLVLVHKASLMAQWTERLHQFLPTARVGIIQGPKCDIVNKDVVLGMIQTVRTRDYSNIIDQFGFLIVDEVHRIGSEEFSKALLKTSTRYTLGISATVERADGLTELIYMFLGPRIFSERESGKKTVVVRAIKYKTDDPAYTETVYDFRGNTAYSTMVSRICDYVPRRHFLLGVLADLRRQNPASQILVLAHNISLLEWLFTHITFAKPAYYIGGMKPAALRESEKCHILLGTFAMASEGMDIPTLSTLVFATPRTNIEQCVGRILRTKHAFLPCVVDIIDSHKCFLNQWNQRRAYYKKMNYTIVYGGGCAAAGGPPEDDAAAAAAELNVCLI
jgi:hypothetical protein